MSWVWRQIRNTPGLTVGQRFLLSAIGDEAASDGLFFIGYRRLAEKCCLDRDFVRQAFRRFRDQGLIEVYSWKRQDGSYTVNGYRLKIELPFEKDNLEYILNRFRNEVGKEGQFAGVLRKGDKGETPKRGVGQGTHTPGPVTPHLWVEETTRGVGSGTHTSGAGTPEVRVREPSGGMGPGTHSSPFPIPVPGNSLLKDGSVSSAPADDAVLTFGEYFGRIRALMGKLPGTRIQSVDRRFVQEFYRRQISFPLIEAACWLSVRRGMHGPGEFTEIKSFRYFKPAIEELVDAKDTSIFRQAAFVRLQLLGESATEEDHRSFERMYGGVS